MILIRDVMRQILTLALSTKYWLLPGHTTARVALTAIVWLWALTMSGQSGTLPVIHIDTDGHRPVTSKTVYVPGNYYVADANNPAMNIGSEDAPLPLEIRGRGHSSWRGAKKPYKIKLGQKAPLLGMKEHKHWALLKFYEPTVAGLQLGDIMGMQWTASTRPVEVVLNGDYLGLYLLTETNRIGRRRLDIYEQPNRNEDPATIPYGWLVEIDNYIETNQISIRENNKWTIQVTYHSPDTLSLAQRSWLTEEFKAMNAAIYDPDKEHSTWEQMIDVDAMARFFIIQEVLDNSDGFHGSFYLHKDRGDGARWVAGPLWDLSCNQREKTDYTFLMKTTYSFAPHWIGELIKDEDFCQAVRRAWREFYPSQVQPWMDYIDNHLLPCQEALEQDKIRWNLTNTETLPQRVDKLKSALQANIEWFNNHLPGEESSVTSISQANSTPVVGIEYVNLAGMRSPRPWSGLNIVVYTHADGTTTTGKTVIR